MTPPGTGEVTCNLFALWGMERVAKVNRSDRFGKDRYKAVTDYWANGPDYPQWDAGVGLMHYASLLEGISAGDPDVGWVRRYIGGWGPPPGDDGSKGAAW
jgi:hypothetical protein